MISARLVSPSSLFICGGRGVKLDMVRATRTPKATQQGIHTINLVSSKWDSVSIHIQSSVYLFFQVVLTGGCLVCITSKIACYVRSTILPTCHHLFYPRLCSE